MMHIPEGIANDNDPFVSKYSVGYGRSPSIDIGFCIQNSAPMSAISQ